MWILRIRHRWSDLLSGTISLALHTWLFLIEKNHVDGLDGVNCPSQDYFTAYSLLPDISAKKANCQKPNLEIHPISVFAFHSSADIIWSVRKQHFEDF